MNVSRSLPLSWFCGAGKLDISLGRQNRITPGEEILVTKPNNFTLGPRAIMFRQS
jgi:hypothetical protein